MRTALFGSGIVGVAAAGLALALASAPVAASHDPEAATEAAGERLGETIEQRIRAEGPFLTTEERALIERRCGYPAGRLDGYSVSISDGILTCDDGRRIDDPEVRAMAEVAGPRISRRVNAVMESAEVRGAIEAVSRQASEQALRSIDHARIAREASAAARVATREALRDARRSIEEARRHTDGEVARALREAERGMREAEREAERARRR